MPMVSHGKLELTLTSRDCQSGRNDAPMCGVPHYHSAEGYIAKLVEQKEILQIAICEQMEGPKKAKGRSGVPEIIR